MIHARIIQKLRDFLVFSNMPLTNDTMVIYLEEGTFEYHKFYLQSIK